jgi:DNA invertase Pin-like site-specific DNA recombinase
MSKTLRCAIYTRKSSEEGLEQSFNSLDAQREACAAYIASQRHEGWQLVPRDYDDGGFSGGSMDRPGLKQLLADVEAGEVDIIVVYKVDRLTRSLSDFARMVEVFDGQGVSFVSVTQQFNTTTSMGRLTLNVLLSFAQFEREVTGERIRDKFAASRRKGIFMGGTVPLGYDLGDRRLLVNPEEAELVRTIFHLYLELGTVAAMREEVHRRGYRSKRRVSKTGRASGGNLFTKGALHAILKNRIYLGEAVHKGQSYPGEHDAIIDRDLWDRVQSTLKEGISASRNGTRARAPSLLVGLLHDAAGNRLTPSHAVKNGKRYRYYTARDGQPPLRLPAHEIEELVTGQVRGLFNDAGRLLNITGNGLSVDQQHRLLESAVDLNGRWDSLSASDHRELLQTVLTRVEVAADRATFQLSVAGLLTRLGIEAKAAPEQVERFEVPFDSRRSGLGKRLVVTSGADEEDLRNPSLVKAVARAHLWYQQLVTGEVPDVRSLARQNGLPEGYLNQTLRLAFMEPSKVELILSGNQPADWTVEKLSRKVPVVW